MEFKSVFFIALTACVVFTLCFILLRNRGASVYTVLLKSMASFCFIVTFMASLSFQEDFLVAYIGLGLGLVCGLIGDILLELKVFNKDTEREYLNGGFVSFGVGHFFYIFALISMATTEWKVGSLLMPILISVALAGVFTLCTYIVTKKVMKMDFGKDTIITMVYSFILSFVTILAISFAILNPAFISLAIGFVLFTLSDLVLSMMYFGGKADSVMLHIINHTLYYLAQIIIASTLFINLLF